MRDLRKNSSSTLTGRRKSLPQRREVRLRGLEDLFYRVSLNSESAEQETMNSEQNGNHPKQRIFLSYARTDEKDAHRVRTLLEALPNTSVFTSDSLSAGES